MRVIKMDRVFEVIGNYTPNSSVKCYLPVGTYVVLSEDDGSDCKNYANTDLDNNPNMVCQYIHKDLLREIL